MKYRICRLRAFTCRPEIWSTTICYEHACIFYYWSTVKIERNVFPTHAPITCLFVHCVKLSTKRKVSLSKQENVFIVNNFKCNIFHRLLPHTRILVVDIFCRRRKKKLSTTISLICVEALKCTLNVQPAEVLYLYFRCLKE